jgi:peptidyl-tRNA hydrolase
MKSKMYVLIRESIPLGKALVAAAHAPLVCYLEHAEHPGMVEWLANSFAKAVCKVNDVEFEKAKEVADHVVITESTLDGQEVALVFVPREEYPKHFVFFRLYK